MGDSMQMTQLLLVVKKQSKTGAIKGEDEAAAAAAGDLQVNKMSARRNAGRKAVDNEAAK
jgi:hypothetical protein